MNVLFRKALAKLAYYSPGGGTVRPFIHKIRGVNIGFNVWISQYVFLDELHPETIHIGNNCTIGLGTTIINHFYWGPRRTNNKSFIIIEDNVYIGPHCVILPNVRIGEGSVIQAGTIISRNVPPNTLWGTKPSESLAKVTIPLTSEHTYEQFLAGLRPTNKHGSQKTKI